MAEQTKTKQEKKAKPTESQQGNGGALASPRSRSLKRHGGFGPLSRLRDEFDRVFDRFFGDRPALWDEGNRDWRWGIDMDETDQSVVVSAEAPGFEAKDFDIQVRGNALVLHASKKAETEDEPRGYRQWRQQEFCECVDLPAGIDADKVEARYRNGVLTVTLPKTEESKGRKIEVKE
jgi:HSP20 family protein